MGTSCNLIDGSGLAPEAIDMSCTCADRQIMHLSNEQIAAASCTVRVAHLNGQRAVHLKGQIVLHLNGEVAPRLNGGSITV